MSGRTITNHFERPREIDQARQRIAENAVRSKLIPVAHHSNGYQTKRVTISLIASTVGRCIEKRLESDPASRVAQQWHNTVAIRRVQPDHHSRLPNRAFSRAIADSPRTVLVFRGYRGLCSNIGDAEFDLRR